MCIILSNCLAYSVPYLVFNTESWIHGISIYPYRIYSFKSGILSCFLRYSSKLSTAAWEYWVDPNAQNYLPFSISALLILPPRYFDGGPIKYSLVSTCFPISSRRISPDLYDTTNSCPCKLVHNRSSYIHQTCLLHDTTHQDPPCLIWTPETPCTFEYGVRNHVRLPFRHKGLLLSIILSHIL